MPQCKWCGKKGVFLKVTKQTGLCSNCQPTIEHKIFSHTDMIQDCFNQLEECENVDRKLSLLDEIKNHASAMIVYHEKDIAKTKPLPNELIKIADEKIQLLMKTSKPYGQLVSEPVCPYCKTMLPKIPKRKVKCKSCGFTIYVNTKQSIFPTTLLTEEEVQALKWFNLLKNYGLMPIDFVNEMKKLSTRFRTSAFPKDVIWSLFGSLVMKLTSQDDFGSLANLYYHMSIFLYQEGRNHLGTLARSREFELKHLIINRSKTFTGVHIIAHVDSCEQCKKLHGKRMTFEEAAKERLLPNMECQRPHDNGKKPFCRCGYSLATKTYRRNRIGLGRDDPITKTVIFTFESHLSLISAVSKQILSSSCVSKLCPFSK